MFTDGKESNDQIKAFRQPGSVSKGQLILNCTFWCLQISQKPNEIFSRISALASKKRSNQQNKGMLYR